MNIEKELKECFESAARDERNGKKHKGLLLSKPNIDAAKEYIAKANQNLEYCEIYLQKGSDYKIPEEWYYSLYYCALAILAKFGVDSRSQRCTAFFLKYVKDKSLIEYEDEFINRIMVYKEKEKKSDVDNREEARYSSWIKSEEVRRKYDTMMALCRKAIAEAKEIIFSDKELKIPKEIIES